MVKFKLDLHTHASDFSKILFIKPNKKDYLLKLINKLFKRGDYLAIGLIDYNDDGRYSKFIKILKTLSKDYIVDYSNRDYFVSIKKRDKIIYFIKGDEISTDKGHILLIGNKKNVRVRNFKNVIKKARKNKWIVIADHPLHEADFGYFIISMLTGDKTNFSLSKKTILKNKKEFDALELNSYFPKDKKSIKKFGKKNKIPIIADSDAHFIGEFFNSYFEIKNLNFENISKFKKSLKKGLKKHVKLHSSQHNLGAKYKHGLQILLEDVGKKTGLVRV